MLEVQFFGLILAFCNEKHHRFSLSLRFPAALIPKMRPLPLAISEPSFRTQIGNGSIPAKQVPFLDILVFSHGEFI